MGRLLNLTIEFVNKSFGEKRSHFQNTLDWLLKLKPEADGSLQIAAYSHDIERAITGVKNVIEKNANSTKGFLDEETLATHQQVGAETMKSFLLQINAERELAGRVYALILKHEVGGTEDQNLLKDADSISFLDVNGISFIDRYFEKMGYYKIRSKIKWVYNRITDKTAQKFAESFYKRDIKYLDEVSQKKSF